MCVLNNGAAKRFAGGLSLVQHGIHMSSVNCNEGEKKSSESIGRNQNEMRFINLRVAMARSGAVSAYSVEKKKKKRNASERAQPIVLNQKYKNIMRRKMQRNVR